jgi:threonine dehydratase
MAELPTPEAILAQRDVIDPVFLDSPVFRHPALDEALGLSCTLKLETLNPIRSFKGRGTEAAVAALRPKSARGIVTTSTGNYGQGIAWAARRRGLEATIVCPADANPLKVAAMRRLGAEVVFAAPEQGAGKDLARDLATERGLALVVDGDYPEIAAGNGTIAQELTDAGLHPDVVVIQVGDGSLATGVGAWLKARSPRTRIIGVIASGAPSMARSLEAGRPVDIPAATIADGMAIDRPVPVALELLPQCVDEFVEVDDNQIATAVRLLMDTAGVLAEPSGATGVAALMADPRFAGLDVAAVVTGSNLDPAVYRLLLDGREGPVSPG